MKAYTWKETVKTWREAQIIRAENPEKFEGINTRLKDLNKIIQGFQYPFYGVVIAKNKGGKTALMLTLAIDFAKRGYLPIFLSEEMRLYQMGTRIVSNMALVDMDKIETFRAIPDDWERIDAAIEELSKLDGYFSYGLRTPKDISDMVREVREANPDKKVILLVDYAQLLHVPGISNPVDMQTHLSRWFRSISQADDAANGVLTPESMLGMGGSNAIGLLTAVQVSKSEKRNKTRLNDASGRGTGAWEEDADYLLVINSVFDMEGEELPNVRNLSITSRFSSSGETKVYFVPSQARFKDFEDDANGKVLI